MYALCASREGVSPVVYYHTRTIAEFMAATEAWVQSWALPARALMGGTKKKTATKGTGRPSREAPARHGSILDALRPNRDSRGNAITKRTIYNLDELLPLDKVWDPNQVNMLKGVMGANNKRGRTLFVTKPPPLVRRPRP